MACTGTGPEIGNRPAEARLSLVRGDQWTRTFKFYEDAAHTTPFDLALASFTAHVYRTLGEDPTATLIVSVTDAPGGELLIDMPESVSRLLQAGVYPKDPDGQHWILVRMVNDGDTRTVLKIFLQVTTGDTPA